MTKPSFEPRDAKLDALRAACAAMEQALSQLPAVEIAIRRRWADLLELLAVRPPRELRECPVRRNVERTASTTRS